MLYLGLMFLAVTAGAFGVLAFFAPRPTHDRLKLIGGGDDDSASKPKTEPGWQKKLVQLTGPVAKLAVPPEGWEASGLRSRFMHAGYRSASAPQAYFAAKAILAFALPALFVIFTGVRNVSFGANAILGWILVLAALGYYLPNVFLAQRIRARQRELFEAFPDAMDLIMVCVEAGLSLDAAIGRAGEEIRLRSPELADEFHLVTLELRAGATRERALRNLALRTGLEEVGNLVAMLVQADRFGTNVADSLRVHSDTLRTKRRLRAEEAAAKIPLKLLFPLIFCMFPSLLLVLLGPAFIRIYRILLPTLSGG